MKSIDRLVLATTLLFSSTHLAACGRKSAEVVPTFEPTAVESPVPNVTPSPTPSITPFPTRSPAPGSTLMPAQNESQAQNPTAISLNDALATVIAMTATPIEETKIANLATLDSDKPKQDRFWAKINDPVIKDSVVVWESTYACSGITINKIDIPPPANYSAEQYTLAIIKTSSHCLTDSDRKNDFNSTGDAVAVIPASKYTLNTGEALTYIGWAADTFATDKNTQTAYMAVLGNKSQFENLPAIGIKRLDQFVLDRTLNCFITGAPLNGIDAALIDEFIIPRGVRVDEGLFVGKSKIGDGGLSGGPLICGDDQSGMLVVGEVQAKDDTNPLTTWVSILSKDYKQTYQQIELDLVQQATEYINNK